MVLLRVKFPRFLIVVSAAKVMAPLAVAAELTLLKRAPLLLSPVPLRVNKLAIVLPLRSKVAPEFTVTRPVPKGPLVTVPDVGVELAPAWRVPLLTVVPPV